MANPRYGDDWKDRDRRDYRSEREYRGRDDRDDRYPPRGSDDQHEAADRSSWRAGEFRDSGRQNFGRGFDEGDFRQDYRRDEGHAFDFARQNQQRDSDDRRGSWQGERQDRQAGMDDYRSERFGASGRGDSGFGTASGGSQGGQVGGFRGKGPKGYSRNDDRIREDVCDHLSDNDALDASGISVGVSNGEVTLDGTVASRWAKRAAEDCVDGCSGVKHVQNNLRVSSEQETAGANTTTAFGQSEAKSRQKDL